ncbi:hypothetical protein WBJ53_11820 [Spirosoma sp. SC4-14]|uniref:hypothetical protein n=1 Tax=Spirosoma sp. SC4-14 TaxID=3128900 RepID=UPI0030D07CC7
MRLIVLLLFATLQPYYYTFAQTTLNGHVVSLAAQQPIESAYVTVCHLPDSLVVAFARTNAYGVFNLTFTPEAGQVYFLRVSHISYRQVNVPLSADIHLPMKVEMEAGSLILNEVQVSAKVSVREKGDSTRYKVDAFRNGSEQTLEEVLKKMPNIRVDDNGDIYFKNKRVDKVFIDGDDLAGNTYQLATRSINPAVLNEVQAIENFSENKLLRKIEQGNQTVLNLAVKDDRKSLLFGMIDAVAGPQRYNGVGNLFSYSKKIKAFAVLSGNNTGIRRLDLTDANATVLTDERPATELLIRPFTQTAQPFPRHLNSPLENLNHEQVGTFNVAVNPTKALKITANLSLLRDRVQAGRLQGYQLISDTPVAYQQADTLQQQPSLVHLKLQINYDLSARTSFLYRGVVGEKTIDLQQITQFITGVQADRFPQQFTNRLTDYRHFIEFTRKINDHQALVVSGQVTRTYLSEQYAARLNPFLALAVFGDSLTNEQAFTQQVGQTNQLAAIQVRWLYGTKTRKFEQQLGFQHNAFDALIQQQNASSSLTNQPLHMDRQTIYSRTSGKLIWPKCEISGYVQLGQVWNVLDKEPGNRSPLQANLTTSYKINRLSQLVLSYDHQAMPVVNTYLIHAPIITDFRTAQQGNKGLLFDVRDQLSLSYLFSDIAYRKMTLLTSLFASRSASFWNLADLSFTSDYTLARLINTPNVYTVGGIGSLEKLVYPLSGNIRVLINALSNQGLQQINGVSRKVNTFVPTATIKYISAFTSPFNVDMGLTYTHTALSVSQENQTFRQQFTIWNGSVQLVFREKLYQLGATIEGNRIQQNNYLFLKANASYVFSPKLSLKLDIMNLQNQTTYQQVTISPATYSVGRFPLLPRMVLAGVRLSF